LLGVRLRQLSGWGGGLYRQDEVGRRGRRCRYRVKCLGGRREN
jgi:hypothetical protein